MSQQHAIKSTTSGAGYFFTGLQLVTQPGTRRFVIIPLLINILLLGGAFATLLTQLNGWIDGWLSYLPSWLEWLSYVLWPLLAIAALVTFSYFFSTIANWIAAPFNGLLAEYIEAKLTGNNPPDDSFKALIKDLPRTMGREWTKLKYYLPKAIGLLILMWIPAIGQTLGPILWFLFSAWMMTIQYVDYPFDNHKVPFIDMRDALKEHRGQALSFGAIVMFFTMTPIINLLVMPVAVCGATAMWVDHYREQFKRY
ncbi:MULTISPECIES: sulfate transporter CysZ [unclassified Photobacterium]|uniref:sulfate transporter CysZ n=1 Tax=unclassified Photobacterium TaxID=2628852 RepID=UPI000D15A783|nr:MULTISPECIES: sulfate transporter CysZ [unclassified Photobacterium]PSV28723.1 sulfate transporter CysZ [Photobacterium sp. GB-56]PSV33428.1 sulfate transporter CysZ [Photobacterium sp. GB-72]PSV39312.1 sulfate transporter CysZ [Photobacterium sp. GB-27]PSV40614.1 sulfate transporter CysZ [Photobacterium sp. GB-210]PSV46586.1 sulfate transporter CysZ [Photobacterium sp. GB-36]